ncbi:MBL fold metallo-hydrolase [Neolewinella antarctica]|uniref:Glyoxylase-like metal-dependent hydrolase (Beta-lactamase superfamily II) n=1 Tax=Neolewinella antarctica TaxID=442734 RepID=A0ABX0XF17_9BACT|nr:MBL fold metallo-hydrolase [Neolewinella antarctica]NJC27486.1 glyoxylase-like metal-dependent hydrolase (beta-lactamase superfamily II) [Neolewinella antarctica]
MTRIIKLTFNPVQENTYIVYDEDTLDAIIFDPGCYDNAEETKLRETIEEHGLTPVKLINTHCHFDHIFGNAFVKSEYRLKLGIHELEEQILRAAPQVVSMYGMPPMTPSPDPDYFIKEGDVIELGDARLEVLLCPGHSPGSLCFYNRGESYLIAGDVLFHRSIGRTDLPLGDHKTLIKSIKNKLLPLPDDVRVYPGHGEATTIGEERRENPFL